MPEKKTFFISRAGADKRWAELIASVVRDAGHEPFFQDEHFQVGQSIPDNMMRGAEADCTIAIFSAAYFKSDYCRKELNVAIFKDPLGRGGKLIPILVAPAELPSFVADITYLNLVGVDEDTARERVLETLLEQGQFDRATLKLTGQTKRVLEQADRNRSAMIQKVRAIWIDGVLKKSLYHEVRILLGLSERPDAVERPFDLLVMRPDKGEQPLPPGTRVVDVYDDSDNSLLILGEPGSGKTTELLVLAQELLDRATTDSYHPIPVMFPLSTWATTRKALAEWLTDELTLRYQVPWDVAVEWVASKKILPLLDGLDEVKPEHRAACVDSINVFRQSRGFLPLVIASRIGDYDALRDRLRLHGAVIVRPLTREQVGAYLNDLRAKGEPVRTAVKEDPLLWDILTSPFMLNVATVAYTTERRTTIQSGTTVSERRDRLFDLYESQTFRRHAADGRYTSERTKHWLRWLAHEMAENGQTVFYLETLQLNWLPIKVRIAVRRANAFVFGIVFGSLGYLVVRSEIALMGAAAVGIAFGMLGARVGLRYLENPWQPGVGFAVAERVRWSPKVLRDYFMSYITGRHRFPRGVASLFMLIAFALSIGRAGWVVGAMASLALGVLLVLFLCGLTYDPIELRVTPNEGIRRSGVNGLVVSVVAAMSVVPVGWAVGEPLLGLIVGPVLGLAGYARGGGDAFLRHFTLRALLRLSGSAPFGYVPFLDYATRLLLLRKVGGGYMFIHRMLLEWFAKQHVKAEVPPQEQVASRQQRVD